MIVLVVPGLVGPALEERLPYLARLAERGRIRRLTLNRGIPEAAWLGLPPTEIAEGPLIVAALGAEPPERSIHFHLSLLGLVDGTIVETSAPTAAEMRVIAPLLPKLNTKRLTGLLGEGLDHALVLEGLWDLGTTPRDSAIGKPLRESIPEGEADEALRRYIEDSVDMLSSLELNARRIDADKPPLNLLFPWGHGMPRRLPNLAVRRGVPAFIESASLRMQGLAKLVGYRHSVRQQVGQGIDTNWTGLAQRTKSNETTFVIVEAFDRLGEEEAAWLASEMDRRFLSEFTEENALVVASSAEGGLLLETGERVPAESRPFRADLLEDRSVPLIDLHEAVDAFLLEPGSYR